MMTQKTRDTLLTTILIAVPFLIFLMFGMMRKISNAQPETIHTTETIMCMPRILQGSTDGLAVGISCNKTTEIDAVDLF